MTPEEHKERHILLHKMLDELLADYIGHNTEQKSFLKMPLEDLLDWSHQQTIEPTEIKHKRSE